MNKKKIILWITTIILSVIFSYSIRIKNDFKWDFFLVIIILWSLYFLRKKLKLHYLHYFLASSFLVLHNLGTFGLYERRFFGIYYDVYMHLLYGFVAGLILYRYYNYSKTYSGWSQILAVVIIVMGFGAFHELMEFSGAIILGDGDGALFLGAGDLDDWDTQKDMLNNFLGSLVA